MSHTEVPKRAVFNEILEDYLAQIRRAWGGMDREALGIGIDQTQAVIPFFGQDHVVSPSRGFRDPQGRQPSHAACVILSKYLLINAGGPGGGGEWVAYKQFPDAASFVEGFANTVERRIARVFAGKPGQLARASADLGGRKPDLDLSYDLVLEFPALPRVPLLLLYNDEEDSFPAQCSVLLPEGAPRYLDMECLAMLGMLLAARLDNSLEPKDENKLLA